MMRILGHTQPNAFYLQTEKIATNLEIYREFSWWVDCPSYRLNAVFPQNSYVEVLTLNVVILGGEALGSNRV